MINKNDVLLQILFVAQSRFYRTLVENGVGPLHAVAAFSLHSIYGGLCGWGSHTFLHFRGQDPSAPETATA